MRQPKLPMRNVAEKTAKGFLTFLRHRKGVTAVTFAVSLVPMLVMAGTAIDISRAFIVKQRLSFAIDAAALAVGSSSGTEAELTTIMQTYFDANYPGAKLGTPAVPVLDLSVPSEVSITAQATVETAFMKIVGYDEVTVNAETTVVRESKALEVALVLDVTGSMCSPCSKRDAMKSAAKEFVKILFGTQAVHPKLGVSVVPFSGGVHVDDFDTKGVAVAAVENADYTDFAGGGGGSWSSCTYARYSGKHDEKDSTAAKGGAWTRISNGSNCPDQKVTPLTNVRATVDTAIDNLTTGGWTHINLGAVWGWRTLSKKAPYTEGKAYSDPENTKAIVIMTDGNNETGSSSHTSYGYLSWGWLGTTSTSTAGDKLDAKLTSVCTKMKNKNIVVYTVTFGSGIDSDTTTLMTNCATDAGKYYHSPTNAQLKVAFQTIATELSNLRIAN